MPVPPTANPASVAPRPRGFSAIGLALFLLTACFGVSLSGDDLEDLKRELRAVRDQSETLRQQLDEQSEMMRSLEEKIRRLEDAGREREESMLLLSEEVESQRREAPPEFGGFQFGNIVIGGEGGVAYFHQGSEGKFSNHEMRVDEAKLFLDAKLGAEVYLFTEINIAQREEPNEELRLGELYVDFENVSRIWNRDRLLSVRAGRFDIPFGEEYQTRDAIDNPLISHSLGDLWGVDEGILLYGDIKKFQYALAVQNGGHPSLRDYDGDKSVTARLGYRPSDWFYGSVSAMRTGDLDVDDDELSEIWFGNGFIRSIGAPATTTKFQANLVEGDAHFLFAKGHVKLAGGYIYYDDDDASADNRRDVYYYMAEGLRRFGDRWHAATRFSHVLADDGFPIVGNGTFGNRFYGNLSTELWQWSAGMGYRWSDNLVFKLEYSYLQGEELGGKERDNENSVAAEVAFGF